MERQLNDVPRRRGGFVGEAASSSGAGGRSRIWRRGRSVAAGVVLLAGVLAPIPVAEAQQRGPNDPPPGETQPDVSPPFNRPRESSAPLIESEQFATPEVVLPAPSDSDVALDGPAVSSSPVEVRAWDGASPVALDGVAPEVAPGVGADGLPLAPPVSAPAEEVPVESPSVSPPVTDPVAEPPVTEEPAGPGSTTTTSPSSTTTTTTPPSSTTTTVPAPSSTTTTTPPSRPTSPSVDPGSKEPVPVAPAKDDGVVRVEVLGQDVVEDLGVEALAFRLNRAADVDGLLPVGVTVDYSAFAELYGADWATRLELVAVPECALTTPELAECQQRTVVPTRNDLVAGALVIDGVAVGDPVPGTRPKLLDGTVLDQDVESLQDEAAARSVFGESEVPVGEFGESTGALAAPPVVGTGGVVFALTAGTGGESGNFSATPLGIDQAWTVGDSSGGFTYSYEIPVQPPFAGTAPEVGLLYSSQSIDGMNFATNSQASAVGLGWDVPQAYIERSFKSCRDDGGAVDDLCWFTDGTGTFDHMSISLNGVSDQIRWTGGSFQITGDPVWRVEQRYGAPHQKGTNFSNPAEHGEFWVVTMKDGTEYWFGYDLGDQHSAWTVPVIGNHPSEPCYQAGDCDQVYKFLLDRVVDTNGNTILYNYDTEINKYAYKTLVYSPRDYVSGGTLSKIVYGIHDTDLSDNSAPTSGLAEVVFNTQYRCGTLDSTCPVPTSSSSAQFPDVPVDLICQGPPCSKTSPSFFGVKRLASVDSRVWNGGWVTTDRVTLAHVFPYANPVEAGVSPRLFLQGVQRTVYPDGPGTFNLPSNFFAPTSASWLASRTYPNPGGGIPATMLPRTADFRDEHGSITYVEYGQQNPCPTNPQKTSGWDTNTFDCYPMWTGGTSPGFIAYNKYLTKKVTAHDATVAVSSDLETTYDYVGAPAWHYDDSVVVSTANKTWSNWRGYEIVRSHTGPAGGPQTHDESRYFRGMHGDRLVGGGTKSVSVGLSDGSATFTDYGWLAGMPVEEITLDSAGSSWMERTRHEYTWSNQGNTDPLWPRWVEESAVTNQLTSGSGPVTSRTRFDYDPDTAEVTYTHDDGDLSTAADDRCTVTASYENWADHILDRPASTALWGRASGGGSVCATGEGQQVGLSQFFYDGGFIGSRGNLTTTISYQSSGHPVTTTASYDGYGRVTSVTNGRGKSTSTGYSPASGWPSQVTVTNPLGHVTRTDYQVERFLPYRVTDPKREGHVRVV